MPSVPEQEDGWARRASTAEGLTVTLSSCHFTVEMLGFYFIVCVYLLIYYFLRQLFVVESLE